MNMNNDTISEEKIAEYERDFRLGLFETRHFEQLTTALRSSRQRVKALEEVADKTEIAVVMYFLRYVSTNEPDEVMPVEDVKEISEALKKAGYLND